MIDPNELCCYYYECGDPPFAVTAFVEGILWSLCHRTHNETESRRLMGRITLRCGRMGARTANWEIPQSLNTEGYWFVKNLAKCEYMEHFSYEERD